MNTKTVLALCSIICLLSAHSCPTSYLGDFLQSGKKTIDNFGRDSYSTSAIIIFSSPIPNPQICVGNIYGYSAVSSIDSYRPDLSGGFDFSVKPKNGNIRRFVSITLQISSDNSWKKADITYLISGRNDMSIGNLPIGYNLNSLTYGNHVARQNLNSKLPQGNYNVAVFISGLKFKNKIDVKIQFGKLLYADDIVQIHFLITHFKNIQGIQFAYIVYPTAHPYLSMTYSNTSSGIGSYVVAGIRSFGENLKILEAQWKIVDRYIDCEGQDCSSHCVRVQQCKELGGKLSNNVCTICPRKSDGTCIKDDSGSNNPYVIDDCPERSKLNPITFICECLFGDEYFIDGKCKKCGDNQFFNGRSCICKNNLYRINGSCRTCDERSTYSRSEKDCICNLGYYGDRNLCEPCHQTCSQCTGPQASQCTLCVDISFTLKNGFCTREGPCQPGTFLSQGQCKECSDYCTSCSSLEVCQKCAVGFLLVKQTFNGQTFSFCQQICGDGRRFAQDCDDGNSKDGDGCSSYCQVETGWFCTNSSSLQKSFCREISESEKVIVNSKSFVNLGSKVIHSVSIPYLPECVIQDQCSQCFKVLEVKVVESLVPVQVFVNYVVNSKYQFAIEYNFLGLFVTSAFKVSVKLSQHFAGCISSEDLDQVFTATIDPTTLNCQQIQSQLDLNNLSVEEEIPEKCSKQVQFTVNN